MRASTASRLAGRVVAATALFLAVAATRAGAQQGTVPDTSARSTPVNLVGMGPNGATLRCRDGSYPPAFAPDAACVDKGGVLIRFRVRGSPAPPRAPAAVKAPPLTEAAPAITAPEPKSQANVRIPAPQMPRGTTLVCRDGTFIVGDTTSARCASHGGVKVRILPERRR